MTDHQDKSVLRVRGENTGGSLDNSFYVKKPNGLKTTSPLRGEYAIKKKKSEVPPKKRVFKREGPRRETKREIFDRRVKTRHMYTKEEQRFIYFYRYVLNMKPTDCHRFFNEYFGHSLGATALTQLAGRMKNLQLDDIINWKHTEEWAVGGDYGVDGDIDTGIHSEMSNMEGRETKVEDLEIDEEYLGADEEDLESGGDETDMEYIP